MGCRLMGRRPTFILMMLLTTSFFVVEIVVGYVTNSMALVADSFHMLSDIISLVVGYFALKLSRKTSGNLIDGNTFGWVRAEVLGALVNAVFLLALCLSILISALKRLVDTEELTNPILILIVGAVGLVVNLVGMLLFHGHAGGAHGHSHGGGGHGHSHGGGHGHSHAHGKKHSHGDNAHDHYVRKDKHNAIENGIHHQVIKASGNSLAPPQLKLEAPASPSMRRFQERTKRVEVILNADVESSVVVTEEANIDVTEEKHPAKSEGQLNMKGVYLHILGDALGSIIVIISAIIVKFVQSKWTLYVDPVMSILMVAIILYSSVPLLKESSRILLQNVPSHIQLKQLEARLLSTFPEIIGIHEFHVWQLAGNKIIASVHVKFNSNADYNRLSPTLKEFFHYEGIHSTTFQPEFEEENQKSLKQCLLACESKSCQEKVCCSLNSLDKVGQDELLTNGHAIPTNEIHITVDGDSFHMEEGLTIETEESTPTKSDTTCSSPNCLSKCTSDDELLTNKHTEPINDVISDDEKSCGISRSSDVTNVSSTPAIIECVDTSSTSNMV